MFFVILILAVFFAVNMGGSSFAAAFSVSYGGKLLSHGRAKILFLLFVMAGAVLYGREVSQTLGAEIISSDLITFKSIVVIFISAGLCMFIGNIIKIPQSTSLVTVAAISGVGFYYHDINMPTIYFCLAFWLILPLLSYLLTYGLTAYVYPPRRINFWIYEKFVNQRNKLKAFAIAASCYNAFSVGTNNVANVVGPILGYGEFPVLGLLILCAFFYGLGGFIFTGAVKTIGEEVVPLGLLSVSIISFVSGSLMLIASFFGVPQSFVMLQLGALFAVSTLKHGPEITFSNPITQKTFYSWAINPVIAFGISYALMHINF